MAPQSSAVQALALDLEREKGKNATHGKVCEERYQAINGTMAALGDDIAAVDGKVDSLSDKIDGVIDKLGEMATAHATAVGVAKGLAEARKPKGWVNTVVTIACVLLAGVIGTFGWMASKIASDYDQRISDAQRRPTSTSTVLVNPSPGTTAPPVTVAPAAPLGDAAGTP